MGFNLGKTLKKIGKGVAKAASFVPGPVGLVGSAAGAALDGKNIGKSVVGDLARNSKISATLLPLAMTGGAAGAAGGAGGGSSLFSLGGLTKLGKGVLDNSDLILGGLSAYDAYQSGKKADRNAQAALDLAREEYEARAPFRRIGMERLLAAQPPSRGPLTIPEREDFQLPPNVNPFFR